LALPLFAELELDELDEPELDEPELDEPELDEPELDEPELDEPELDEPELDELLDGLAACPMDVATPKMIPLKRAALNFMLVWGR